jgi:hypothetical protein
LPDSSNTIARLIALGSRLVDGVSSLAERTTRQFIDDSRARDDLLRLLQMDGPPDEEAIDVVRAHIDRHLDDPEYRRDATRTLAEMEADPDGRAEIKRVAGA